jgi:hypothetical protein
MGVPPAIIHFRLSSSWFFHEINHPASLGFPHLWNPDLLHGTRRHPKDDLPARPLMLWRKAVEVHGKVGSGFPNTRIGGDHDLWMIHGYIYIYVYIILYIILYII